MPFSEAALTHALLAQILDVLPTAVTVFDAGQRLVYANARFEPDATARKKLVGQTSAALAAEPGVAPSFGAVWLETMQDVMQDVTPERGQVQCAEGITGPGGQARHVEHTLVPLQHADGTTRLVVCMTQVAAHRLVPQATSPPDQVKEQFLANMSHEMRTPLNVVQGMAYLLLHDAMTDEQRRQVRTIHMAAEDLLQLINQVLSFAQLEAGDLVFRTEPFRLRPLLADLDQRFRRLAEAKGLQFVLHVDVDLPGAVMGDAERLKQVLHQLLSNTVTFTEQGSVHLSVAYEAPNTVHFEIADSGVGMDAEQLPHLFAPFVQAEGADDRTYGGTGLGLSLVRTLVEGMNGTIDIESAVGEGTTVTLRLSLSATEALVIPPTRPSGEPGPERRVLVVEDNLLNQEVICRMLERWGVTVLVASSGPEALTILADTSVDAVLMDLQMPGMDGYATARRIRATIEASHDNLPIIATTASVLGRRQQQLADAGINACVTKPFGPEELWRCLHPYLHLDAATSPGAQAEGGGAGYRFINLAHMRANAFGSTSFLCKVLDICLDQLPDFIDQLSRAVADADWKAVAFVVHKMKSTTSTVGADELTDKLQAVEVLLKDAEPDQDMVQAQLSVIMDEVGAVLHELERERRTYA